MPSSKPRIHPHQGVLPLLIALVLFVPVSGRAQGFRSYERIIGTLSLGVTGGVQYWSLDGLSEGLADREAQFAEDGYNLSGGDFGPTYGYGLELQLRLSDRWFVRTQAEWTRLQAETRDRQFLLTLGGRARTPVSIGYTTRVKTRPMLFSLGLGRSLRYTSVRWGLSGNWVIAPIKVVDELELFMESSTKSEIESNGVGHGFEAQLSLDYFTDTNMTLYVETYYRLGATTVEIDATAWESSILPGKRRVDFDGAGVRLGFRWI